MRTSQPLNPPHGRSLIIGTLIPPALMGAAWWLVLDRASPFAAVVDGHPGTVIWVTLLMSVVSGFVATLWARRRGTAVLGAGLTYAGAIIFGAAWFAWLTAMGHIVPEPPQGILALIAAALYGGFWGGIVGIPCAVLGALGGIFVSPPKDTP